MKGFQVWKVPVTAKQLKSVTVGGTDRLVSFET